MFWKPKREPTTSNPTYDVDKDAPPWTYPISPETRWTRKAVESAQQIVYDAYPDKEIGEPIAYPDPKPELKGVIQPRLMGQLKLIVQGPTVSKEVPLEKGFLEMFENLSRLQQGHLAHLIAITVKDVQGEEEGQGLAEYALVLALIAIIAIVALLFLGAQISNMMNQLGTSI